MAGRWGGRTLLVTAVVSVGCGGNEVGPPPNPVMEFTVSNQPGALAVGPDGNIWYTEILPPRAGYLTPTGFSTDFWTGFLAGDITTGPDGNLWLTAGTIFSLTTAGAVQTTGVNLGTLGAAGIVTGPDGALWFTEGGDYKIGRVTTDGSSFQEYPLASGHEPWVIIVGPDGNLWFTEMGTSAEYIGRITPAGEISEFTLADSPTLVAAGMAVGLDGNIWFTAYDRFNQTTSKIGRIDVRGNITLYDLPINDADPKGITSGSDGNLWFVESGIDRIGRVTTAGQVTEFQLPTRGADVSSIVTGSDGKLWFAESSFTTIGSLEP